MKRLKKRILEVIAEVAVREFGGDGSTWPPPCIGYIYQPNRPDSIKKYQKKERV